MNLIIGLLLVVEVLTSFLLIGIILLQKSKSEGLGMAFGAGAGESLFGARAGNVLSKATVVLGIVFIVTTLLLGMSFARQSEQVWMDQVPAVSQGVAPVQAEPAGSMVVIPEEEIVIEEEVVIEAKPVEVSDDQ